MPISYDEYSNIGTFSPIDSIRKAASTMSKHPKIVIPLLILSIFEFTEEIINLRYLDTLYTSISLLLSPLMLGTTIGMYQDICSNKELSLIDNLKNAKNKFARLIGVLLLFVLTAGIPFALVFFLAISWATKNYGPFFAEDFTTFTSFILIMAIPLVIMHTFFAYAIQAVMIENRNTVDSIKRSFSISWNNFFKTLFIVVLFVLVGSPFYVLEYGNWSIFADTFSGVYLIKPIITGLGNCWALIAITEAFMKATNFSNYNH